MNTVLVQIPISTQKNMKMDGLLIV
jgi:hypothetical protein